ncbi:MAG TPA: transposase [Herpetosiphonaceae bacterium]|nr:transposase [Herpetosiphonaceae bacterium]
MVCLDEMGPESAKSFAGQQVVRTHATADQPAERAMQAVDYGRRGRGYIFGAFCPHSGAAFTRPYPSRSTANWVDFLEQVEGWLPADVPQVYAILDNLAAHRATDVLLFTLAHPRWEFVFQPTKAAYLNLIEPWWKILRSLALKGRRFASWEEVCQAVEAATAYWNKHRHPFKWGERRRHRRRSLVTAPIRTFWNHRQPVRHPGIAVLPKVA